MGMSTLYLCVHGAGKVGEDELVVAHEELRRLDRRSTGQVIANLARVLDRVTDEREVRRRHTAAARASDRRPGRCGGVGGVDGAIGAETKPHPARMGWKSGRWDSKPSRIWRIPKEISGLQGRAQ